MGRRRTLPAFSVAVPFMIEANFMQNVFLSGEILEKQLKLHFLRRYIN